MSPLASGTLNEPSVPFPLAGPDPDFISGFKTTARLGFVQKDALRGYWAGVIMVGDEWKPPGASHPERDS